MSHYIDVKTQIKDTEALVRALKRVGMTNIEVHETAQNLYGYQNDLRNQKAHVIIRKKYVGHASNDIGFEKKKDGFFVAHISEFDQGTGEYKNRNSKYGVAWQKKLYTYYGVEVCKKEYDKKGWDYVEEVDEKDRIRLRAFV